MCADVLDDLKASVMRGQGTDCLGVYTRSIEEIERLRASLQSIADNTCCESCQEAAKWARAALTPKPQRDYL